MKTLLLFVWTLLFNFFVSYSQDQIIRTTGNIINCEIISIDSAKIDFLIKTSDRKITTYINIKDVSSYRYKDNTVILKEANSYEESNNKIESSIEQQKTKVRTSDSNISYLELKKVSKNKIVRIDINEKVVIGLYDDKDRHKIKKARLMEIDSNNIIFQPNNRKYNPVTYNITTLDFIGYRTTGSKILGYTLGTFEVVLFCFAASFGGFAIFPNIGRITYITREFPNPNWVISIQHQQNTGTAGAERFRTN